MKPIRVVYDLFKHSEGWTDFYGEELNRWSSVALAISFNIPAMLCK